VRSVSLDGGQKASRLEIQGSVVDINNDFYDRGWTDGLPIIPPTEDLVLQMLEASPIAGGTVLGDMCPRLLSGSAGRDQGGASAPI
jgi:hypothetical protein